MHGKGGGGETQAWEGFNLLLTGFEEAMGHESRNLGSSRNQ